jgi:hypothetical protein
LLSLARLRHSARFAHPSTVAAAIHVRATPPLKDREEVVFACALGWGRSFSHLSVTQQYLIGQFSALLGDLPPAPSKRLAAAVHDLRQQVESCPVAMLPELSRRAIKLTDAICWAALERGDGDRFCRYAKGAYALREFADTAGLSRD